MNLERVQVTTLMQFPAIAKGNTVQILDPDLAKLTEEQLESIAKTLSGELIWVKLQGSHSLPADPCCINKDCYEKAIEDSDQCSGHSFYNGIPLYNKDEPRIQS